MVLLDGKSPVAPYPSIQGRGCSDDPRGGETGSDPAWSLLTRTLELER